MWLLSEKNKKNIFQLPSLIDLYETQNWSGWGYKWAVGPILHNKEKSNFL